MNFTRKSGISNGENIWKGIQYKLPMRDGKVQGFVLDSTGLWKTIIGKDPELISSSETDPKVKLERDFFRPRGKREIIDFENTGSQIY